MSTSQNRHGLLSPLHLNREAADTVGTIITQRMCSQHAPDISTPLDALRAHFRGPNFPFDGLDRFAKKLQKASARRHAPEKDQVCIWRLTRAEAMAGFHYLALLSHVAELAGFKGDPLSSSEKQAILQVVSAVAKCLRKRGRPHLSRQDAERVIENQEHYDGVATLTFANRLRTYLNYRDDLEATPTNPVPLALLQILR